MAPTVSKPPAKRKAPTFKPPIPLSRANKSTKVTAPRRKSASSTTVKRGRIARIDEQSSASQEEADDSDDDDDDVFPPSAPLREASLESDAASSSPSLSHDPPPTIPPALLTRLLHHHFSTKGNVRISKEANGAVGKYMETFVREAIARAAFERAESVEKNGEGGRRVAGEFLEVSRVRERCGLEERGANE